VLLLRQTVHAFRLQSPLHNVATRAYRKLITRAAERNEILPGTKMRRERERERERLLTGLAPDTCPAYVSPAVINRVRFAAPLLLLPHHLPLAPFSLYRPVATTEIKGVNLRIVRECLHGVL